MFQRIWFLGMVVVLLMGCNSAESTPITQLTPTATSPLSPTSTSTIRSTLTATSTDTPLPTATQASSPTPTNTPTILATETPTPTLEPTRIKQPPHGSIVYWNYDSHLEVIDVLSGEQSQLPLPNGRPERVKVSPNREEVAMWITNENTLQLWLGTLAAWEPKLLLSTETTQNADGGQLNWISHNLLHWSLVEMEGNSLSSTIGTWIYNIEIEQVLFESSTAWLCVTCCAIEVNSDVQKVGVGCEIVHDENPQYMQFNDQAVSFTSELEDAFQWIYLADIAWSPENNLTAFSSHALHILDETGRLLLKHDDGPYTSASNIVWSKNNHIAYSIFDSRECNNYCVYLLMNSGTDWEHIALSDRLRGFNAPQMAWDETGAYLAIGDGETDSLQILDSATQSVVKTFHDMPIYQALGWIGTTK